MPTISEETICGGCNRNLEDLTISDFLQVNDQI